jgi:hypothetical protein
MLNVNIMNKKHWNLIDKLLFNKKIQNEAIWQLWIIKL